MDRDEKLAPMISSMIEEAQNIFNAMNDIGKSLFIKELGAFIDKVKQIQLEGGYQKKK